MANPQIENGYIRIATEIVEALARTDIPAGVRRILDVVFRKTYGFGKKEDQISIDQFREATGLSRRTVIYAIQEAEAKKLLFVSRKITAGFNFPNTYSFNKNYDMWVVQGSAPQAESNRQVAKVSSAKLRKSVKKAEGSAKLRKGVVQNSVKNGKSFAPTIDIKDKETIDRDASVPTPKENAQKFFDGVLDMVGGKPVDWLKDMLTGMAGADASLGKKKALWDEIRAFCQYWTEKNPTGTRELWQMQKTFEVDRRLSTWFKRAGKGGFSSAGFAKATKGKEIIGLDS